MLQVTSSIIIDAPAERVWYILTNVNFYKCWNPFVIGGSGRIEEGLNLNVAIRSASFAPRRTVLHVVKVRPPFGFKIRERMLFECVLNAEYAFWLQISGPEGMRFVQTTTYRGLLVPFMRYRLNHSTVWRRQDAMNRALKRLAEGWGRNGEEHALVLNRPVVLVGDVMSPTRPTEHAHF
ncbi:MAG: hypothetical protein GF344_12055 [Chitinivibrionales bacterium]|nr:hypothetical protein [Chitinivibrionales bacterium]MBD3357511.1 hypothetical protein [Chitinivibrionales bacterium]